MPSSLIFVGLVVLWLLILVPAVARRRQEVVRPSEAALAGRVLARPVRHGTLEVDGMDTDEKQTVPRARAADPREHDRPDLRESELEVTARLDMLADLEEDRAPDADGEIDDDADHRAEPDEGYAAAGYYSYEPEERGSRPVDDRRWERPAAAFRPGRGGFDAEAAALAARARYTFRQRVVIALLVLAVVSAGAALFVTPMLWWVHGLVDLALVGYLVYLRRQVRMEESIRARRAARMAGTRRAAAADDPELDGWARRGREAAGDDVEESDEDWADAEAEWDEASAEPQPAHDEDWTDDDGAPERVRGTGEPVGVLPAHRRGAQGQTVESALPRLQPAPPPPLPAGTQLVDVYAEDDDLPAGSPEDLRGTGPSYRPAKGA